MSHVRRMRDGMQGGLVLTRREFERVFIGDPANPIGVIEVVRIDAGRVRLRFIGFEGVPVNRKELADKINSEP